MEKGIQAIFSALPRILLLPHQHFKFLGFKVQYSPEATVLHEEERKWPPYVVLQGPPHQCHTPWISGDEQEAWV